MIRRKYVLRYGMTNTYIGEARDICTYNGVDDYVRVGDYIIVDSLAEAIPFTKKKAKELLKVLLQTNRIQIRLAENCTLSHIAENNKGRLVNDCRISSCMKRCVSAVSSIKLGLILLKLL